MKKKIPPSIVVEGHPDYDLLNAIKLDLEARAGGAGKLQEKIPALLRREIDSVLRTPKTGRRSYAQLEKVERTYIGTLVELMLRSELDLPRGRLDTVLCGVDVDIKHTMGSSWMIPTEAFESPCILVAADEKTSLCYLGLIVARREYLRDGHNKDKKTGIKAEDWKNILWLYRELPYPPNFWRMLEERDVDHIFSAKSGNERVRRLFRLAQEIPITREAVEAVARQLDFMRRTRADNGRGTRDLLAKEGILILTKTLDRKLIEAFNLPMADFVSYAPKTPEELKIARRLGRRI